MKSFKIFISILVLFVSTKVSAQKFEKEVLVGLSMNNFIGDDMESVDMKMGFHAGFTARYNFIKNCFLEGSLGIATKGYKSGRFMSSGQYWLDEDANYDSDMSSKYTSYNVELPILVGYKFVLNDDLNFKVKVGPYLTYAISGKAKTEGYITTYPDIHSSETEYIDNETKISDMDGFNRFGCGIHAGISADYKRFILSASYQRAFTKVFGDNDAYEQNILISVGYRF